MSEIEKRLRENRSRNKSEQLLKESVFKIGDKVKVTDGADIYEDEAEVIGIKEDGLYTVKVGEMTSDLEAMYLRPVSTGMDTAASTELDETKRKKNLLRATPQDVSTAIKPSITESVGELDIKDLRIYSTTEEGQIVFEFKNGSSLIYYPLISDEDYEKSWRGILAVDKLVDRLRDLQSNPQDFLDLLRDNLLPRDFDRFLNSLRESAPALREDRAEFPRFQDTIEDKLVESPQIGENSEDRFNSLWDKISGQFWGRLTDLVDDIEEEGFLVTSFNEEYVVVELGDEDSDESKLIYLSVVYRGDKPSTISVKSMK